MKFNYKLEPGRNLKERKQLLKQEKPQISIITPFYNTKEQLIKETANSILNQTYPCFEWLIIDDGSTNPESLKVLEEIQKLDERIKVFHKKNEGLAQTRDYGAKMSCESSKYLLFIDDDDELSNIFAECAYWTLETNPGASWAYSDSVGFGVQEYTWRKWYYPLKEKKENQLISAAMIRKKDFFEVGGYELKEKNVFEDWNFWLKLISKEKYPVKMSFLGLWYRRKNQNDGELARAKANHEKAMEYIENTAKKITTVKEGVQYPKQDYNWDEIVDEFDGIVTPKLKEDGKTKILMIIPWMITGGADRFNYELIKRMNKEKYEFIIISTLPSTNEQKQEFEEYATVYDLTSFLDQKYWVSFINYLIEKNNIKIIFNTNSQIGYCMLPYLKSRYPELSIIDYVHMEEWYYRNGGFARDSKAVDFVINKTLTCNKSTERLLKEKFGKNDVETVYIGVDEKIFDPDLYNKEEILKEFGLNPENKKVICFVCRIAEQKRPFLMLDIIKDLKKIRNDFLCVVAGDGFLLNDVKNKAKEYDIDNDIIFLGNIEDTAKIYAISDLNLNCSIKEGVALTSYESLAMGIPVVSSDVGGQKELINEDVGKLVKCMQKEEDVKNFIYEQEEIDNYVQAVDMILNNLEKYKKSCRKRILDNFTLDKMVKNMQDVFEEQANISTIEKVIYNSEICKEIITYCFMNTKAEYEYLSNVFVEKNIDRDFRYEGKHKAKYKIKNFIVKVLKKLRIYEIVRKII